jgi:F0F1-type ATP synthase alpha subunit
VKELELRSDEDAYSDLPMESSSNTVERCKGIKVTIWRYSIETYWLSSRAAQLVMERGPRVALRAKVADTMVTGLSVVDALLPIGRGQRQLILGDRMTGKTSIFISTISINNLNNLLGTIDGFGSKRLFSLYIGICQNLSKLYKLYHV